MLKFMKPYQKPHPLSPADSTTSAYHLEVPTMLPHRLLRTTTLFSSLRFHQIGLWISLSLSPSPSRYCRPFSCIFLSQTGPKIERSLPLFGIPAFITLREICTKPLFGGWGLGNPDLFCWIPYVMLGSFSPRVIEGEALAKHLLDLVQGQSLYIVLSFIPLRIIRDTRHPNPMTTILDSKLCSNIGQIY